MNFSLIWNVEFSFYISLLILQTTNLNISYDFLSSLAISLVKFQMCIMFNF